MSMRTRDILPFLFGFACAFLLTSLKVSVNDLDNFNTSNQHLTRTSIASSQVESHVRGSDDRSHKRKKIKAFIGIQTGFTLNPDDPRYDYALRRESLRNVWFPRSQKELDRLEKESGIVMRFIIGHSKNADAEKLIEKESKKFGGFMRLPLEEGYLNLANKTLTFFRHVSELYEAEYIWKVDDDVYFRIDRALPVMDQWKAMSADYIGCMKTGPIYTSPEYRWYEPSHALLGSEYFTHCWGTAYVLSGRAVDAVVNIPDGLLRFFANEDVTVGSWMLALDMVHYDDRRLCATECSDVNVILYDMPQCAGLCDAATRVEELDMDEECHLPAVKEDGTVPMVMPAIDFRIP